MDALDGNEQDPVGWAADVVMDLTNLAPRIFIIAVIQTYAPKQPFGRAQQAEIGMVKNINMSSKLNAELELWSH